MSDSLNLTAAHRIYTNEIERERLRQGSYDMTPNRLSLNRHRIRRAGARQLTIIAIVASENRDRTILNECRARLELETGARLADTYELVESRRPSREVRFGFASNRLVRFEILPAVVTNSFPLTETRAMAAASADRLV